MQEAKEMVGKKSKRIKIPKHLGGHANTTHIDEGTLRYLIEKLDVRTMFDLGCGPGGQIEIAKELGLLAIGIDGDPNVNPAILHDFTAGPYQPRYLYDLCWCVEFIEHIKPEFVSNFLPCILSCNWLVVTAAPPGKRGHHHVNCQPWDYWRTLFSTKGFELSEEHTLGVRKHSTMEREFIRDRGFVLRRTSYQASS